MPRLEGHVILVNGTLVKFRTDLTRDEIAKQFSFNGTDEGYAHVTGRNDHGNTVDLHFRREAVAAVVYNEEAAIKG
jgi:hypothetical protein